MDLKIHVEVYGFGSSFDCTNHNFSDVDVLLVHDSLCRESINFVIRCKRWLQEKASNCDITMLSQQEEQSLGFVLKSAAKHLGEITPEDFESQISALAVCIGARQFYTS